MDYPGLELENFDKQIKKLLNIDDDIESLTKAIQRKEYYLLPKAIEHVKSITNVKLDK